MLLIACPWCGARAETEFTYGGEADLQARDPFALSDAEWADYLFMRRNPRGAHRELWYHSQGCRRWFCVERDTVSYGIASSFRGCQPVRGGRACSHRWTTVGASIVHAAGLSLQRRGLSGL